MKSERHLGPEQIWMSIRTELGHVIEEGGHMKK